MAIETANGGGWTEEMFLDCLRKRNCIGMVVERGDVIEGFMMYSLERDELRLLTVGVKNHRQRTGRALMAKLAYKVVSHKRERWTAEVWEGDLRALLFFKAVGALAVGVDGDMVRMKYTPGDEDYERLGYTRPVNRVAKWLEK